MQLKAALITLAGLSAIAEAAVVNRRSPVERALHRRQFGGGNFGGGGGNNNNNGGNNNDGNNDNNNDGNNGDNNDGNNNGGGGGGGAALEAENVQDASNNDGQADQDAGQSPSQT